MNINRNTRTISKSQSASKPDLPKSMSTMHAFVGAPVRWRLPPPQAPSAPRRIPPTAKKPGFKKRPKPVRDSGASGPGTAPQAPSGATRPEDYVPRGPTLRAEYEMRGLVEPEVNVADAGVLPEIVANRMLSRILLFGGMPLGLLFAFFAAYFVLTYKFEVRVLPAVVAYSTLGLIGVSAVGISYGIFSSSWDVEDEGSRFGWTEAKVNVMRARDGLMRQRRNEEQMDEFDRIDEIAQKVREEEKGKK